MFQIKWNLQSSKVDDDNDIKTIMMINMFFVDNRHTAAVYIAIIMVEGFSAIAGGNCLKSKPIPASSYTVTTVMSALHCRRSAHHNILTFFSGLFHFSSFQCILPADMLTALHHNTSTSSFLNSSILPSGCVVSLQLHPPIDLMSDDLIS